jgi:hypothetical protein
MKMKAWAKADDEILTIGEEDWDDGTTTEHAEITTVNELADIAKAQGRCDGASTASSSISKRWSVRADRTFRFHGWNRASCVQLAGIEG